MFGQRHSYHQGTNFYSGSTRSKFTTIFSLSKTQVSNVYTVCDIIFEAQVDRALLRSNVAENWIFLRVFSGNIKFLIKAVSKGANSRTRTDGHDVHIQIIFFLCNECLQAICYRTVNCMFCKGENCAKLRLLQRFAAECPILEYYAL
jgi:hypothetical protein